MPVTAPTKARNLSIYLAMGVIGILAVFVGFSKTFFIPVSQGTFKAPVMVHVHGAFAFAWVIFYVLQTFLIHKRNLRTHRSVGWAGAFIAFGVGVTMVPVGLYQVERELKLGLGETAVSGIVGVITGGFMFIVLVGAGLYYRNKPEVHKALMLVATIFVLWPAWARFRHFFPSVPRPDIWFGLVLAEGFIVIAWILDWRRRGKINRTLLYVGAFIIVESTFEVLMFDSSGWRVVAQSIYSTVLGLM
jgi:hypothetical protein